MIISASRRTDLPAFYSEWLYNRLREEYVLVRNPIGAFSSLDSHIFIHCLSPLFCLRREYQKLQCQCKSGLPVLSAEMPICQNSDGKEIHTPCNKSKSSAETIATRRHL